MLASTAGTFSYIVKMWMDPKGNPSESTGTATRKAIMDGRYVTGEYSGTFKMPGADGKMKDMNFKGMSLDAYDNVKQKFVSSWIDNMGTGIMMLDGTYDAATKTFTYAGDYEMMPGMKIEGARSDQDHRQRHDHGVLRRSRPGRNEIHGDQLHPQEVADSLPF